MSKNNLTLSKTEAASVCKQLSFACHWLSSPCLGLGQITARSLKCPKPVEPCHLERSRDSCFRPVSKRNGRILPFHPSQQPWPRGSLGLAASPVSGKRRAPSRSVTAHSRRPRGSLSLKARGARRAVWRSSLHGADSRQALARQFWPRPHRQHLRPCCADDRRGKA